MIKTKAIDFKDNKYINIGKELNDKDPKFKVGDHVRISGYKNIFAKGCTPNWSEEIFVIKEIKNAVPWTYVINDLNGQEIIRTFNEYKLVNIFLDHMSLLEETFMSKLIYLIMHKKKLI